MSERKQKKPQSSRKDESRVLPILFAGVFCFAIATILGYSTWSVFGSQARENGVTSSFLAKIGIDNLSAEESTTESNELDNSGEIKKVEPNNDDSEETEETELIEETDAISNSETSKKISGVAKVTGKEVRVGGGKTQRPLQRFVVEDFLIAETEVTNSQYAEFIKSTNHPAPKGWKKEIFPANKGNYPVVNVSWSDANAYCRWLTKEYKMQVRLPSQAEWELAARGPNGFKYPWGNQWNDEGVEKKKDSNANPVKKYELNKSPYGAYDMLGNVWEWTSEQVTRKELESEKVKNATNKNEKIYLVLGGSFKENRKKLSNTFWVELKANLKNNSVGFRYVIIPNELDIHNTKNDINGTN